MKTKELSQRELEKVDDTTNEIMDMIRKEFNLNPDSDRDDEIYGFIHNEIKQILETK